MAYLLTSHTFHSLPLVRPLARPLVRPLARPLARPLVRPLARSESVTDSSKDTNTLNSSVIHSSALPPFDPLSMQQDHLASWAKISIEILF